MTPERFRKILTREDRSLSAFGWRLLLETVRPLYAVGVWFRNRNFDRDPRKITHAAVPVLSIGNLTLGGTGKSPAVLRIAQELESMGLKVAVLSRGYRAKEQNPGVRTHTETQDHAANSVSAGHLNDEGKEMARRLPNAVFLQNPNRCESACRAVEEFGAQILLLDDGFQHRKLFRNGDIVLIDAEEPFGLTGRLFPCGTLREPMQSLARADVVVLTHSDRLTPRERHSLQEELAERFPSPKPRLWVESVHCPSALTDTRGNILPKEDFQEKRLGAFCGIGKPAGFFRSLDEFGLAVHAEKIYPDHHPFGTKEIAELTQWAQENRLDALVCTEKDAVKLPPALPTGTPIAVLRIELEFLEGKDLFLRWLRKIALQTEK